jgi:hypothetical protein
MKHRTKNTLRAMAEKIGLKVVFVSYFGDDVHGRLLVREKRILINAHKPRTEHIFTLLHEVGHYVQHVLQPNRKHHPRLCDVRWKIELLENLCKKLRRYFRFIFSKEASKEWEADLWAFCAFICLAKQMKCKKDLMAFVDRHPEKTKTFYLAALGVTLGGIKNRLKQLVHIFYPFGQSKQFAKSSPT